MLGIDERTRILQVKLSPWRMIVALDIVGPWGEFIGTGWLVGPRTVVTAGHCVYDRNQMGGWAQKITLTFGQDEEVQTAGPLLSTKFTALDRWVQSQDGNDAHPTGKRTQGGIWRPSARGDASL